MVQRGRRKIDAALTAKHSKYVFIRYVNEIISVHLLRLLARLLVPATTQQRVDVVDTLGGVH